MRLPRFAHPSTSGAHPSRGVNLANSVFDASRMRSSSWCPRAGPVMGTARGLPADGGAPCFTIEREESAVRLVGTLRMNDAALAWRDLHAAVGAARSG